jgi:hypothetical protein
MRITTLIFLIFILRKRFINQWLLPHERELLIDLLFVLRLFVLEDLVRWSL